MHPHRDRTRRRLSPFVRLASVVLALAASGCTADGGRTPRARDVVVIVVEALRSDRVSAQRGGPGVSPHIDRAAAEGVLYTRATSPATWCVPAYGSLLTGRWPSFHGAERSAERVHELDADAATLAEILGDAGLATAVFAEEGSGLAAAGGVTRGFARREVVAPRDGELGEKVAVWLASHPEPSFLLVAVGGLDAPDASTAGDRGEAYDRAASAADRRVGEVLDALRAGGRYRDAVVVITADHGKLLGEHGPIAEGRPPFEPQVRVPLIVKHAGEARAGESVARRVSTLGVFATVLEAAGVAPRRGAQAKPLDDLHPVWVEELDARGARLRAGYDGPDVKLISLADRNDAAVCFFDLVADPGEIRPRCDADAAPILRAALASFSRRPRPARPPASVAAVPDPAEEGGRVAN